jgi:HEAT repeat protein
MYDYMRSGKANVEEIMNAAEIATLGEISNLDTLKSFLKNDDSAVRYWGATGLLILGENALPAIEELKAATTDKSANVVAMAAEALYNLGEKETAKKALISVLKNPNEMARCHALNVIDCIGENSPEMVQAVADVVKSAEKLSREQYDLRGAKWLFEKWGLNPADYKIEFNW